jgi:hypothetical protein
LALVFLPYVGGWKTLMLGVWDAPSIVDSGAYDPSPRTGLRLDRTPDPGAPAWVTEPWLKLISHLLWTEHSLPLWNPYSGYGTPLAAAMQPQPFYPLTIVASLHVNAWTYNLFMLARLFVAGALMFLFARQFLDELASLVSAITFMLTGYFVLYLNMPHVSVEVLAPGLLFTLELLLRKNSWAAVGGVAAMIALGVIAGMPESTFLIMAFGSMYLVCRLVFTAEYRKLFLPLLGKFVAAVMFGLSLSAFLLLPFVEFLMVGHDVHQPSNTTGDRVGLVGDHDVRTTIFYLLPLIFGPVYQSILTNFFGPTGIRSYWGIVATLLALVAVISLVGSDKRGGQKSSRLLVTFFSVALLLMLLKRFAHPLINWIGYLPISEMVLYAKYQEPLVALCVAMLAGFGFSRLPDRRVGSRTIVIAAIIVIGIMLVTAWSYWPQILQVQKYAVFFYLSLAAGILCVVVGASLMTLRAFASSPRIGQWLAVGIVGLLTLELSVNYIVPAFYMYNSPPPASRSPYRGAPFVDFLQIHSADHSRIFGRQKLLFPNWSAAFELSDVRLLDALYYHRYITFIRSFLLTADERQRSGELADRFTGSVLAHDFETELERRFLTLSSVKYLLSATEYGWSSQTLDGILAQYRDQHIWGFGPDIFRPGAAGRSASRGLLQRAPSNRIAFKTTIDPAKPIFEAVAAIKMEAADKSAGASFRLEVKIGDTIEELFSTILNPQGVPDDRNGRPIRIDLTKYSGQEVELLFSTGPGPNGNNAWDWTGWIQPGFVAKDSTPVVSSFKKIYDREALIYEVPSTLPRAALFRAVEVVRDDDVLNRLKDPAFNPLETLVLSRESLSDIDPTAVRRLVEAKPVPFTAASILTYQSQRVQIEVNIDAPSALMLTDANYPGWRAYVNGERVPVLAANYLFRAVIVPAGKNSVEFVYQPTSVRSGGLISLATLLGLAGLVYWERIGRQKSYRTRVQAH